jgi:hypothetical protein
MNGSLWSDMELQELYEVVNDLDWFETVRPFLPARSDAAIRTRMCQLRIEAGIVPQRNGPRSFSRAIGERDKARYASERLRSAILEAA